MVDIKFRFIDEQVSDFDLRMEVSRKHPKISKLRSACYRILQKRATDLKLKKIKFLKNRICFLLSSRVIVRLHIIPEDQELRR